MDTLSPSTQNKLFQLLPEDNSASWSRAKTTLRIISVIFAVGALVESFILLRGSTAMVLPVLPISASVACILWNCSVFVLTRIRNPWISKVRAVHIVIETTICMIGFSATAVQAISIEPSAHVSDLFWTLIGSLGIFSVSHFVLFIRCCIESSRRRKDKRVQQLIQSLFQENQQSMGLSTVSPVSPQAPTILDHNQQRLYMIQRLNQAAELPSKPAVAELAASSEPVELPGDVVYVRNRSIIDSK